MEDMERERSRRRGELAWFAGSLALLTLLGLPSLFYPFGRDQAMFAFIADRWQHGALPYRDSWDIKPPGVFWIYSLAQACFGRNMAAARWADLLAALATAAGLTAMVRRRSPASHAFVTVLLFGLAYFTTFGYWDTAQAESFAAPLAVLMMLSVVRARDKNAVGWWAIAGGCLGSLLLLKTTFLLFAALPILAWMQARFRSQAPSAIITGAMACLLGVVVPLAITAVYFAGHGAFGALVELFVAQAGYAHGQHGQFWSRAAGACMALLLQPAIALCGVCTVITVMRERRFCPDRTLSVTWLGLSILLAAAQGRFYVYHWLPIVPPLALLAYEPLVQGWQAVCRHPSFTARTAGQALLGMALLFPAALFAPRLYQAWQLASGCVLPVAYWRQFQGPACYSVTDDLEAAVYARDHTRPEETILVLAFEPTINFLSDRACPTRHLSTAPLIGETQIPFALRHRWQEEQIEDAAARPPRFLILGAGTRIEGLVYEDRNRVVFGGREYVYAAQAGQFGLYRRTDDQDRSAHRTPCLKKVCQWGSASVAGLCPRER